MERFSLYSYNLEYQLFSVPRVVIFIYSGFNLHKTRVKSELERLEIPHKMDKLVLLYIEFH